MRFTRSILTLGLAFILGLSIQTALAAPHSPSESAESASHAVAEKKVNINVASAEQLKKIKGIGTAKAEAIVNYRTEHGPFKSVDALSEVKGFSPKVVATLVKKNPDVMTVE